MILEIDSNSRNIGAGISTTDSITPIDLRIDPITNDLLVSVISETINATLATQTKIDQNGNNTFYGISDVDGVTLVPIRTNATGALLITEI